MPLIELVRRDAARRLGPAALRREVRACGASDERWRDAEREIAGEMRRSLRGAGRLVDAFARAAAADGGREPRGRAARLRASWLVHLGRDRAALAPSRRAIALLDGAARDGARLGLAASLLRLGRFADAQRACAAVRRDARRRSDPVIEGAALLNEAVAIDEGGSPQRARPVYRRARELLAATDRKDLAATATQNLANACALLDDHDEAAALYDEAARAFEALGQARESARCRMNRGELLAVTDRLGAADAELREAERALRVAGDPLLAAMARRFRGEALLRAGLFPEAGHALRTAARAMRRGAPPVENARTVALLARLAASDGNPRAVEPLLRASRSVDPAVRDELLGRADAALGRAGDAERRLSVAARRFGEGRPSGRARCLAAAAFCALEGGRPADALRTAAEAERVAERLGVPGLRFGAAAVAFLAADAAGDRERAGGALTRAAAALEDLRGGLRGDAMRASLLRGREAWLARAVRFLLEGPGGDESALAFLERWKARALLDLLDGTERPVGSSDRVAALRARVAALEAQAEGRAGPTFLRAQAAPARPVASRLRSAERELLEALRDRGGVAADPAAASREIAAVRASVPAGTCLVSLFADDHGGFAFVVGPPGIRVIPGLPSRGAVEGLVRSLRFRFGAMTLGDEFVRRHERRLGRAADEVLARLSPLALGSLEEVLDGASRVTFVPHGPWHHVPFAALPRRGLPLVATHSVSLAPSVASLAAPPPRATGHAVVVAVEDELAPDLRREGERVAAALGATFLRGSVATADALACLDGPSCLHIAAHGRARADAPELSGVRLADGWFRAAEFSRLRLGGSLVVLSGCETGVASVGAGDEIHGLVRGVLASGAADLVASLWRVDDEGTTALMERFHAFRAGGLVPADALAAAQREAAGRGAHPWRWAGFGVHSRWL